ncbi:hypothetical protein SARC_03966 [Sphaeroforma arctica JP610]|uniref:Uncharacterized protein n=1 Tax=Sphaeroforma arctica JP610 TaxID=667725 RepID=A0A0L0G413_9EUKA|nr:hypothetical protein SARC_03966 [Sphaeroforma arctica JP610]KNC83790.1 hypothetical protein SARC_03966 [Sphaeroforma arctica JP610]|eukprot:XP_014157692.1 hypothetical protein SARC_03966 [Sphaeroforma arctica JP610]
MFKRSSYKLDSVAADFVGDHKDPITVSDIFDGYETSLDTKSTLYTDVGLYCVKDSALVHVLAHKVTALIYLVELSRECSVSIDTIRIAGQQHRVFSNMYQTFAPRGIILNYPKAMHVSGRDTLGECQRS